MSKLAERAELNLNTLYRTVFAKSKRELEGPPGHELQLKVRPMRKRDLSQARTAFFDHGAAGALCEDCREMKVDPTLPALPGSHVLTHSPHTSMLGPNPTARVRESLIRGSG
jgi:hypothetical protein